MVDADDYLLHLSRYIHKNPLAAGLVESLIDYSWSSYPDYVGFRTNTVPWLYKQEVYGQLNIKRMHKKKYRQFVESDENQEDLEIFYSKERLSTVLGDEDFIAQANAFSEDFSDELSYFERQSLKPSIADIVNAVSDVYQVDCAKIYCSQKGRLAKNNARSVAMYLSQLIGGYRLSDIARAFSLNHYGGVSNAISRLKKEMEDNKDLLITIKVIINRLDP